MDELILFFSKYGVNLTLIAILGIMLLGLLKHLNLFKKLAEPSRHIIYIIITVGFSLIVTITYLAAIGQLTIEYILTLALALFALNQAFYNLLKVTPIGKIFGKLLDFVLTILKIKKSANDNNSPTKQK